MLYFKNCNTAEELKKTYRELAKKLHPDCGGNAEVFKSMQAEYAKMWDLLKDIHATKEGTTYKANKETDETAAEYMDLINWLLKFDGITVEVCGSWVWVSGNTFPIKEELKAHRFSFSKNKKAWYFHRDPYMKRGNHVCTLDEIREMYGSKKFEKEHEEKEMLKAN